jgi:hypothetical protein
MNKNIHGDMGIKEKSFINFTRALKIYLIGFLGMKA